jgi:hypothetical protein
MTNQCSKLCKTNIYAKYSVLTVVEKMYKMQHLDGSCTPSYHYLISSPSHNIHCFVLQPMIYHLHEHCNVNCPILSQNFKSLKVLNFQFNAHQFFKLCSITGKVIMICDSERDEGKGINVF